MLFSIVKDIYEYYKAQSAISLFQINESSLQRFWGFKLEYLIHVTYTIQFARTKSNSVSRSF